MVYPALLPLMRTPQLPVVDWTDAHADLNGLVLFAERRNIVSARVPSHLKRSLPINSSLSTITLYSSFITTQTIQSHLLRYTPVLLRNVYGVIHLLFLLLLLTTNITYENITCVDHSENISRIIRLWDMIPCILKIVIFSYRMLYSIVQCVYLS